MVGCVGRVWRVLLGVLEVIWVCGVRLYGRINKRIKNLGVVSKEISCSFSFFRVVGIVSLVGERRVEVCLNFTLLARFFFIVLWLRGVLEFNWGEESIYTGIIRCNLLGFE